MSTPRLLKPAEAGEVLGVHADTIRRMVAHGTLRSVDVGSPGFPRLRIREDDLHEYIDDRTRAAPSAS